MTPRTIRIITAIIGAASAILAMGDKLVSMPGLPGWLTSSWPLVLVAAGLFKNIATAILPPESK